MIRTWPIPTPNRTIHVIGDIHAGVIAQARMDKVVADLSSGFVPTPVVRIQIGDLVESGGNPSHGTAARAFMDGIEDGADWYTMAGNHDLYVSGSTPNQTSRSFATWFSEYAPHSGATQNYVIDLTFCALLVVNPDNLPAAWPPCNLSSTTLDWLDAQLAAHAARICLVFSHCPLANTVLDGGGWNSTVDYFQQHVDADIRAVLSAHGNAKAWVSGHTHSPLDARNVVMTETIGGRSFGHINVSAIRGLGSGQTIWDPIITPYLTVFDDRIEVRWRNHGNGAWVGPVATGRTASVLFT